MTESEKEALKRLFDSLATLFANCSFDTDEVLGLLESSCREAKSNAKMHKTPIGDPIDSDLVDFYARMARLWRSSPEYTNELGDPLELPVRGESVSMESLYEAAVDGMEEVPSRCDFATSLGHLLSHGMIAEASDERYRLAMIAFRTRSSNGSAVVPQIDYISDLAGTVAFNATTKHGGRSQLVSRVRRFPREQLGRVVEMIEGEGTNFIKGIDEFLESNAESVGSPSDEQLSVGVGLFLALRNPDGSLYYEELHEDPKVFQL